MHIVRKSATLKVKVFVSFYMHVFILRLRRKAVGPIGFVEPNGRRKGQNALLLSKCKSQWRNETDWDTSSARLQRCRSATLPGCSIIAIIALPRYTITLYNVYSVYKIPDI